MKYTKYITAFVATVSLCACYGVLSPGFSGASENPIAVASQATGLTFASKIETIPGGEIDWAHNRVYAVGIGKAREDFTGRQAELMAKRGAFIVAARNAALVLAGIRVGPGGTFENVRNGWIRADVTLTGFREVDSTYDPRTRTATARMEIPLYGLRGAVTVLGLTGEKPRRRWTWPKESGEGKPYEVIVIDVRGMHCKPGVLPRIATEDKRCVFDATEILSDGALRRPAARYVTISRKIKIPEKADRNHRRCLTVKARRIDKNGAIVLDKTNLEILTRAPEAQKTLRKGRLLIVTDE